MRDSAAEAIASVAKGLAECGATDAGTSVSTHPVGRALLECLPEGKRELQAAACVALGMVSVGAFQFATALQHQCLLQHA